MKRTKINKTIYEINTKSCKFTIFTHFSLVSPNVLARFQYLRHNVYTYVTYVYCLPLTRSLGGLTTVCI